MEYVMNDMGAARDGGCVYVWHIDMEWSTSGNSGPLPAVARKIEEIEAVGWRLEQSTFSLHPVYNGQGTAFLIFRPKV